MANGVVRLGAAAAVVVALAIGASRRYGWDGEAALAAFRGIKDRLGFWAIPIYVGAHTLTLALCLPSAVFFEAGASLLFGFLPAILCVFAAKVLGASLSFWIGRSVASSLSLTFAYYAMRSICLLYCTRIWGVYENFLKWEQETSVFLFIYLFFK